jgi:hypothetical protein
VNVKRDNKLALTAMACAALAIAPVAYSTTYTGQIIGVQSQPSPTTPGNIRVSIQITLVAGCNGFGGQWYSYDLPAGPAANMYGAILLAAINTGRSVVISGSGNCDLYNVETVNAIEAL